MIDEHQQVQIIGSISASPKVLVEKLCISAERVEYSRILKMYWIFCRERQFQLQREKRRQFGRWWTKCIYDISSYFVRFDCSLDWKNNFIRREKVRMWTSRHSVSYQHSYCDHLITVWASGKKTAKSIWGERWQDLKTSQILWKVDKKGRGPYDWRFHCKQTEN